MGDGPTNPNRLQNLNIQPTVKQESYQQPQQKTERWFQRAASKIFHRAESQKIQSTTNNESQTTKPQEDNAVRNALSEISNLTDTQEKLNESVEVSYERMSAGAFHMYKSIAEELRYLGLGDFNLSIKGDNQNIRPSLYEAVEMQRIGEDNWVLFDEVKQAVIEATGQKDKDVFIDWGQISERRKVQPIIDKKILDIEERQARRRGVELQDVLKEKLSHSTYLPKRDEITSAFPTKEGFAEYFNGLRTYEVYTREMISSFADYLERGMPEYGGDTKILEVGAGNGQLTYFLQRELQSRDRPQNFNLVATDDESWSKPVPEGAAITDNVMKEGVKNLFTNGEIDYRNMDCRTAVSIIKPDIVISSWMPPGEDWTAVFRAEPSVQEYILIGQPAGVTGSYDSWQSQQGFENQYIDDHYFTDYASGKGYIKGQLCKNDEPPYDGSESWTMSFKRKQ